MKVVFIITLLSGILPVSLAVTCYECTGYDSVCSDEYTGDIQHEADCSVTYGALNDGGCSKLKVDGKVLGVKATSVTRSCGMKYDNSQCVHKKRKKERTKDGLVQTWSCSCKGSKCNSGTKVVAKSSIIILLYALVTHM